MVVVVVVVVVVDLNSGVSSVSVEQSEGPVEQVAQKESPSQCLKKVNTRQCPISDITLLSFGQDFPSTD